MDEGKTSSSNIVGSVNSSSKTSMIVGGAILIILGGLGIGWFVSGKKTVSKMASNNAAVAIVNSPIEAGVQDISSIKDVASATGTLQAGGLRGEGTFHLDRPGGSTQTVVLTATTFDMTPFVGKKVQIWGQTQAGQYASWFMDVMKIKVVQ